MLDAVRNSGVDEWLGLLLFGFAGRCDRKDTIDAFTKLLKDWARVYGLSLDHTHVAGGKFWQLNWRLHCELSRKYRSLSYC